MADWKTALEKDGKGRVAKVIAVPPGTEGYEADDDLFPEWDDWLKIEDEGGAPLIDIVEDQEEEVEAPEAEDVEEEEQDEAAEEARDGQATPQTDTDV